MKRIIALLLAVIMSTSLVGCGKTMCSIEGCGNEAVTDDSFEEILCSKHLANKKAFEASKNAYDNIKAAYELTDAVGSDLYNGLQIIISIGNVSRMGNGNAIDILAEECLNLSVEEIKAGLSYSLAKYKYNKSWGELSEEDKNEYLKLAEEYSYKVETNGENVLFITAWTIIHAHELNNDINDAQKYLDEAKEQMREISDKYADYEYYPNLKGYYTTVSAYLDTIVNFKMSFDAYEENYTTYETEARNYRSDLDFIFEE